MGLIHRREGILELEFIFNFMASQRQVLDISAILITYIFSVAAVSLLLNSVYAQGNELSTSLSGWEEVPSNNSSARGWGMFKEMDNSIWYKINVTGLDKIMKAHLHLGETGKNGDPIVMLFDSGPTGLINGTLVSGNITTGDFLGPMSGKSIADILSKMKSGEIYLNIHTGSFPNGELRGQISFTNATTTN